MIPEHAVTEYLQGHGWPDAESTLAGISGTPGIAWVVQGRPAEHAGDSLVGDWLEDTEAARERSGAALGVLVTRRADYGTARVASWWAHVDVATLARMVRAGVTVPDTVQLAPMRMHLSLAVHLIRTAGYGAPLSTVAVGP